MLLNFKATILCKFGKWWHHQSIQVSSNSVYQTRICYELSPPCINSLILINNNSFILLDSPLNCVNLFFHFVDGEGLNTLRELHKFISGVESIPPLGLPDRITVKFRHGCQLHCKCRPTASTCDPSITLPVHYSDANDFRESMLSALTEGYGFGFL